MRLATLLIIAGIPAAACDLDGSYADAKRTLHGAEVYIQNNLALTHYPEVQCVFAMPPHGAITVIWTHAPGKDPDIAAIIPPPGYVAIPPDATIAEGGAVRVLIVEEVMG
jgi:hypothetical protein